LTFVSVIIPAYNEAKHIISCIESLLTQDYGNGIEIIIVDNGSDDNTYEIAAEYQYKYPEKIKVLRLEKNLGPGAARNLGSLKARGEIVVFLDADMVFPSDFIKKLVEPLLKGMAKSTTHSEEIIKNIDNPWVKVQGQKVKFSGRPTGDVFRAILKDEFLKHNGFDPTFRYHDDRTFFYKTGLKAMVVDGARCFHNNPDSWREILRRNYWIGRTLLAVTLHERGYKGLFHVAALILLRFIDLIAIPSLLTWLTLKTTIPPTVSDILLIGPAIVFTALLVKMKILESSSIIEALALRLFYAPAYRVLRAAGLLAGVTASLIRGLRYKTPANLSQKQPPSQPH